MCELVRCCGNCAWWVTREKIEPESGSLNFWGGRQNRVLPLPFLPLPEGSDPPVFIEKDYSKDPDAEGKCARHIAPRELSKIIATLVTEDVQTRVARMACGKEPGPRLEFVFDKATKPACRDWQTGDEAVRDEYFRSVRYTSGSRRHLDLLCD